MLVIENPFVTPPVGARWAHRAGDHRVSRPPESPAGPRPITPGRA